MANSVSHVDPQIKAFLLQCLVIISICSSSLQIPLYHSKTSRELLRYLKHSMARAERMLSEESAQSMPILRRRTKNTLMRDFNGSHDEYIGKDTPPKRGHLDESSRFEFEKVYKNFLKTNLGVENEEDVRPHLAIRKPASTRHRRKLFCRSGYLIEILPNGTVRGTQDHGSPYTHLTILMYARQLVVIRTAHPPYRYLVMDENSKVNAVKQRTIQSLFFYRAGRKDSNNNYLTFQRVYKRQNNWYLALKKKDDEPYGTMRKGKNTNPDKRSAQFIAVRY